MEPSSSSWNALMQYGFLRVLANDGRIDPHELAMLERIALRDGEVDERERAVLARILERASAAELDASARQALDAFKARHHID